MWKAASTASRGTSLTTTPPSALRADTRHVGSVLDWWSDPVTAPLRTSPDGRSATAMVAGCRAGEPQRPDPRCRPIGAASYRPVRASRQHRGQSPNDTPMQIAAWQSATIVGVAAVIAVLLRARLSVRAAAIVLLTADLSLAVAWPLAADGARDTIGNRFGIFLDAGRGPDDRNHHRSHHAGRAAQVRRRSFGPPPSATACPRSPCPGRVSPYSPARCCWPELALHGVGTAGLGVFGTCGFVDGAACPDRACRAIRQLPAPTTGAGWTGRCRYPSLLLRPWAQCWRSAYPSSGCGGVWPKPDKAQAAHKSFGNALPDVVVIRSGPEEQPRSSPSTRSACVWWEFPCAQGGSRRHNSAGVRGPDASLSSRGRRTRRPAGQQAGSFVPAVTAIKSMKSIIG